MDPSVDKWFNWVNEGAGQKAIWERLEKKCAESASENTDEDAEEDAEE
eukprot:CAMPEP_0201523790 /NCGR_PEP_ID=MMETSP0161_2-20130828/20925_1 /ASSEMBLY_ACC=CAM_ASM_000251 /TAXON_ID=180227 /ORGANISM="Neoparamoeba aestuarina, Strain SoJaBio B1-5/56/2" /LENGTH=47 /DNA_ID= /DNA_START= /DNA_END= /DNA_ORIENTATION=